MSDYPDQQPLFHTSLFNHPSNQSFNPHHVTGTSAVPPQRGDSDGMGWSRGDHPGLWTVRRDYSAPWQSWEVHAASPESQRYPSAHPVDTQSTLSPLSGSRVYENPAFQPTPASALPPVSALLSGVKSADRIVLRQYYARLGLPLEEEALDEVQTQLMGGLRLAQRPTEASRVEREPASEPAPYARRRIVVEEEVSPGKRGGDHFGQALVHESAHAEPESLHTYLPVPSAPPADVSTVQPVQASSQPARPRASPEAARQLLDQSKQVPLPQDEKSSDLIDLNSSEGKEQAPNQPAAFAVQADQPGPSQPPGAGPSQAQQMSKSAKRRARRAAGKGKAPVASPAQHQPAQQQPLQQSAPPVKTEAGTTQKRDQRSSTSGSSAQPPAAKAHAFAGAESDQQGPSLNPGGIPEGRAERDRMERHYSDTLHELRRRRTPERVRSSPRPSMETRAHSQGWATSGPQQQTVPLHYPPPPQFHFGQRAPYPQVPVWQPQQPVSSEAYLAAMYQPGHQAPPPPPRPAEPYAQPSLLPDQAAAEPAPTAPVPTQSAPAAQPTRYRAGYTRRERPLLPMDGPDEEESDEWVTSDTYTGDRGTRVDNLVRSSKQLVVPRLGRDATYGTYAAWRNDVHMVGIMTRTDLTTIPSEQLQVLARQVLEQDLFDDLRRGGDLGTGCNWQSICTRIKEILGITRPLLRARLRDFKQGKDQSPQDFIKDLLFLAQEGEAGDTYAKDCLLANVNETTYRLLSEKLDLQAALSPNRQSLEEVPFSRLVAIMREGSVLGNAGYPLKVEKVKLHRTKKTDSTAKKPPSANAVMHLADDEDVLRPEPCNGYVLPLPSQNRVTFIGEEPAAAVRRLEAALGLAQDVETEMVREQENLAEKFSYAEDVYSLALTTALVLEHSRQVAEREGDEEGVRLVEGAASEMLDHVQAYFTAAHPSIAAVEMVPRRARRETAPTTLFDVVRGFARKMPLARLLELETDVRPYMAAVVVEALRAAGDTLIIPEDLQVHRISNSEFEDKKLDLSAKQYQPFGLLTSLSRSGQQEDEVERGRRREAERDDVMRTMAERMGQMMDVLGRMQQRVMTQEEQDSNMADRDTRPQAGNDTDDHRASKASRQRSIKPLPFPASQRPFIAQVAEGIYAIKSKTHQARVVALGFPKQQLEDLAVAKRAVVQIGDTSPYIYAAILPPLDDPDRDTRPCFRTVAMVDTGATFSLISSAACKAHGLKIEPYTGAFKCAANNQASLMGQVDLALQINNQIVLEVKGLKVQDSEVYSFLLGADLLTGDGKLLGQVDVRLGRGITWEVLKDDAIYRTPIIASRPAVIHAVNPSDAAPTKQPHSHAAPSDKATKGKDTSASKGSGKGDSVASTPARLDKMSSTTFTRQQLAQLHDLAEKRTQQVSSNVPISEAKVLCGEVSQWLSATGAPMPLQRGLGRCLWRRFRAPSHSQRCAELIAAFDKGVDHFRGVLQTIGLREDQVFD